MLLTPEPVEFDVCCERAFEFRMPMQDASTLNFICNINPTRLANTILAQIKRYRQINNTVTLARFQNTYKIHSPTDQNQFQRELLRVAS
jgi:hypothetical protein